MARVYRSWKRYGWILVLIATPVLASEPDGVPGRATQEPSAATDGPRLITQLVSVPREDVRPITPEQIEKGRQAVVAAAQRLERYLAYGSDANAAAWKRYLKWDDMQRQISAEAEPDARVLGEILAQYYTGARGLERPVFVELRESLLGYRRQLLATGEELARLYQEQLAAIENNLQSGAADTGGPLADLTARLEWLEQLGQAPQLVADIRRQFGHANLLVSASSQAIRTGFDESVSELSDVNEMILNTHVCGTAHTTGTLSASLVPCDEMAILELTLSGVANSQTVGRQSPVRIYSQGVTQVFARKRLLIDHLGVRSEPATAHCTTDNHIYRIQPDSHFASNLIQRVAWKRARQQEPLAERISARRAERRLANRMDQQTLDRIAQGNTRLDKKVRRPLRERSIYPRSLRVWTTGQRLQMAAVQGRPNQLAAPSSPPQAAEHQVVAQVHESMLLNTAVNAIGGLTVTDERAQDLVKELTGEVPEGLQLKQDEDPWAITFDLQRPLRIELRDDQIVIAIRGRRFLRGDQELRQTTQIAATYQLGIENGRAHLTRVGDIDVSYPDNDGDRLSLTELRNKTFLTNKFESVFKPELSGDGIQLTDRWEKLRDLKLAHISAENGWLTLGWN
jgi:hypothetical protein